VSTRTILEICYMIASGAVTGFVTWAAAWGYPQGQATIWPVGLVAMGIVIAMGAKPALDSWRVDRASRPDA
jgi:hypothetical protein